MQDYWKRPLHSSYDYIVIGSGSAGSVVAARLAEDKQNKVLLLEAGPSDQHIYIRMPAALAFPLQSDRFNWRLKSEPEAELNNRVIEEARGKTLGGSSSINGMNWVRGNPWDYNHWSELGNTGWSYAEVLPYFKKSEHYNRGNATYRGGDGPMMIESCDAKGPLYEAFLRAGQEAGLPLVEDANAYRQEGVHITQRNVGKGLRWSTSQGYIHNRGRQENLHVVTEAIVDKIVFSGNQATHVIGKCLEENFSIGVRAEVILCAGAMHSPAILQRSGVGNAEWLRGLGIDVVVDLPGVGEGLKDHLAAPVTYTSPKGSSVASQFNLLGRGKLAAQWLLDKTGPGAGNFFEVGAFIHTQAGLPAPDVQFEFIPFLGEFQHGKISLAEGFQYFFSLLRPTSKGRVWIDSKDPASPPRFQFNYLSTEQDRQTAIRAVKAIRKIVNQPAWQAYNTGEIIPGKQIQSDEDILAAIREHAGTNYHPCCSCRMGTDDMAVVNHEAKVHGLANVRVVDASIMPDIVSGNLNAPVIMMAEKVSDLIRQRTPLSAQDVPFYHTEQPVLIE